MRRFEASAKYSSLQARTVELRAEEARFVVLEKVESMVSAEIVPEVDMFAELVKCQLSKDKRISAILVQLRSIRSLLSK